MLTPHSALTTSQLHCLDTLVAGPELSFTDVLTNLLVIFKMQVYQSSTGLFYFAVYLLAVEGGEPSSCKWT